jgi:formate-dependent nitrite reductase membrane component NrfD
MKPTADELLAATRPSASSTSGSATHRVPSQRWSRYDGTTYYGRPAVKPSPFDWRIGVYLAVSGVAGAAQIIAALAERIAPGRMRPVVRNARHLAAGGAVGGALLLITDLKTPGRWYNMLRIYRRTSAMSIGSYILTAFGALSGVALLGEWFKGSQASRVARTVQVPAAAAGAGMLTYTGALLSSTSTPLWASEAPWLSARFAASGIAAGAAALSLAEQLAGRHHSAATVDRIMLAGAAAYAFLSHASRQQRRRAGADASLEQPFGTMHQVGSTLAVAVPVACHLFGALSGRDRRTPSLLAALAVLAGTALSRHAFVQAGNASARQPTQSLRAAQGEHGRNDAKPSPSRTLR